MDFQNRVGSKTGGGGAASYSESQRDRKERLAALAAETIDLQKGQWKKVSYNQIVLRFKVLLSPWFYNRLQKKILALRLYVAI